MVLANFLFIFEPKYMSLALIVTSSYKCHLERSREEGDNIKH